MKPETFLRKFQERVDRGPHPGGCWHWTGGLTHDGYGRAWYRDRDGLAHRLAYELAHGVSLDPGQVLMHACDNRRCVNPDHLGIGTKLENNRDCIAKLRHRFGERGVDAKLTNEAVRDIRSRFAADANTKFELAEKYGVSHSLVCRIINGKKWSHVK